MNAPAPTSRALAPIDEMRQTLTRMEPEFATALPAHIPAERFRRVTMTAIQANPDLLNADRRSLLGAVMKCAQDGLVPDGRDAALVIFKTKDRQTGEYRLLAQYLPMVAGILKKVRQSKELATIGAHVVYQGDSFEYVLGDDERIVHVPAMTNRGQPVAAYAIAKLKDGSIQREVMTIEEIERVRAVSRAKDNGPWVQWWTEMARKTVLRRLAKYLPSNTELEQFWQRQDEAEPTTIEHQPAPEPRRPGPSRLREALATVSAASNEEIAEVAGTIEVVDSETGVITEVAAETAAAEPEPALSPDDEARSKAMNFIAGAHDQKTLGEIEDFWEGNRRSVEQLPGEWPAKVREAIEAHRKTLQQAAAAARRAGR